MARWRLTQPHYLNVPGTEWEYRETSRQTGKQARRVFPVPMLLDTRSEADCNPEGEIVVAWEGSEKRHDHIFIGDPTPDMEPLDDEAEAVSERLRPKWIHPVDSLPANGGDFSQSLISTFERQMTELLSKVGKDTGSAAVKGVSPDEFEVLKQQVAALAARNAELEAAQTTAKPSVRRP